MGPSKGSPLDEVSWTSPPLGSAEYSCSFLEARFGEPQGSNLDSNGVGLFDAWLMRFDCGLEVALWIFHQRPDRTPVTDPAQPAVVELHANQTERGHILFHLLSHLGLSREDWSWWEPDPGRDGPPDWQVRRLDDNGNEYEVRRVSSRCEAESIAAELEARGHKQTYWVAGQPT